MPTTKTVTTMTTTPSTKTTTAAEASAAVKAAAIMHNDGSDDSILKWLQPSNKKNKSINI